MFLQRINEEDFFFNCWGRGRNNTIFSAELIFVWSSKCIYIYFAHSSRESIKMCFIINIFFTAISSILLTNKVIVSCSILIQLHLFFIRLFAEDAWKIINNSIRSDCKCMSVSCVQHPLYFFILFNSRWRRSQRFIFFFMRTALIPLRFQCIIDAMVPYLINRKFIFVKMAIL